MLDFANETHDKELASHILDFYSILPHAKNNE